MVACNNSLPYARYFLRELYSIATSLIRAQLEMQFIRLLFEAPIAQFTAHHRIRR